MHRLCSNPAVGTVHDGNGNISALLDSADGSLDAKYEYEAFGEPLQVAGTAIADDNPFRFSTKYLDSDGARKRVDGDAEGVARRAEEAGALWALMRQSGLIYYSFRYYSLSLGRFLNRDPLGEAGGSNLYGFVENDPVNGWDYLGLDDELVCDPADYSAGVCDDGGGVDYSWIEDPWRWGAEGWYFDWDLWNWRWNKRPKFEEGPEFYFDMELIRMEAGCIEGGCEVPVQQRPQDQAPQDDGPSILEPDNGTNGGDRQIDPTIGMEDIEDAAIYALEAASVFDPYGVSDAALATIYADRDQYVDATLSAVGIVPVLGDAVKWIGKAVYKGVKAFKKWRAASRVVKLRQQYVDAVTGLANKVPQMRRAGMSSEQIARALHAERRALGVKYKDITDPKLLQQIYQRILKKYGDKLGPSIEWLRKQGKSWDDIIESASRPGGADLEF